MTFANKYTLSLLLLLSSVFSFYGQNGELRGVLNDAEFNDILPFANITIKGTSKGTTSDFEGVYNLQLPEGTHTIVFSYMGYEDVIVSEVLITQGKVTELNVTLKPQSAQLEEVRITATRVRNTEASMVSFKKNQLI